MSDRIAQELAVIESNMNYLNRLANRYRDEQRENEILQREVDKLWDEYRVALVTRRIDRLRERAEDISGTGSNGEYVEYNGHIYSGI